MGSGCDFEDYSLLIVIPYEKEAVIRWRWKNCVVPHCL